MAMYKNRRESIKNKESDDWQTQGRDSYDEYLMAMKRVYQHSSSVPIDLKSPRERYRKQEAMRRTLVTEELEGGLDMQEANRVSTMASMVPDEIINNCLDYSIRRYETALMFIDVSGFTELCEKYTKTGHGGPSKLTQVLNSYIGAMVQEILTHNGDVLKFSGDAFLSMWRKSNTGATMQDMVHTAIDCGLIIQKNYGTHHVADVGVVLKVKVAISAGLSHFSIIGDENVSHYVIVGQPVWDVKTAEYMSTAGDVLTTASVWQYVNEAEYCTQPCGDGTHTKVLGVGQTWKRVEKIGYVFSDIGLYKATRTKSFVLSEEPRYEPEQKKLSYKEYSLRPSVISAIRNSLAPTLRRFMVIPVLRAVQNDEPMDLLTEVRHVIVVFLNIITKTVTADVLIGVVDTAFKIVNSITSENGGIMNKVSMFDKDMMFLIVFGLRGLKHEDEARKALLCADQIKRNLTDTNIITVSIGVTSGTTYCGVVGHDLRREYTVIGSAVNKAARLMMAYPNKVSCDKETFVRSKLELGLFKLNEPKTLKGIARPGPVYEFNKTGWPERVMTWRQPLLGRHDEMVKFKQIFQNALTHYDEKFTKYRDHKYAVALLGPKMAGKKRLIDEFMSMAAHYNSGKITLRESDTVPFNTIRLITFKLLLDNKFKNWRENLENRIRYSLGGMNISALQVHGINVIFDCRFPLPENYDYQGDLLSELDVKIVVQAVFTKNLSSLRLIAIRNAQYIDDYSWRLILMLLETKSVFVIISIDDEAQMSEIASSSVSNSMIVKMPIHGIDRWYNGAIACQLLDVQAIPADLEKVIESASGGLPGWIQNFVISLVQRGELTVVTVPRNEAVEAGAVMPSPLLLQQQTDCDRSHSTLTGYGAYDPDIGSSLSSLKAFKKPDTDSLSTETDLIQMAVLPESFHFEDIHVDISMDVTILKTYDSLTPFEKVLLKCGSVLGESFTRRMLLHLLQCDSPRKVYQAVAKLFEIRVLECEGGDFTRDTSAVIVHAAPATPGGKPPFCRCLGTRQPPDCRDLPVYAFCGYMKFKYPLFRTTTYALLTESQKVELHTRALLYMERNTRRCTYCGSGCFVKLFGVRINDGLIQESPALKKLREQISSLSAETRLKNETELLTPANKNNVPQTSATYETMISDDFRRLSRKSNRTKRIRSFSSLELGSCECMTILLSVYGEVLDHALAVGAIPDEEGTHCEMLFELYMEYADLSIITMNIPQALRLLAEIEQMQYITKPCSGNWCSIKWMKDYKMARILTLRGFCMLESGDINEARADLMKAMKLYCANFPSSNVSVKVRNMSASFHQFMTLYVCPRFYMGTERPGVDGYFYEDVANTLNKLFLLFNESKETEYATLAAKWSLAYAQKTNSNFRLLCICYANMIRVYRQKRKFAICEKLEYMALNLCHRKRGQLDVTEVPAVCALYTNIFLFYVQYGKKSESLDFGLSVIPLISNFYDLTTCQLLVLWLLKLLLADLRIHEMVMIMREFFYMADHYDFSSETWYYVFAVVILLDTGYCVESYGSCERFYNKIGDAIMRSKTPEAAWNFFTAMWLVTIRVGAWERSILWEEKIKQILTVKLRNTDFVITLLIRLAEGYLITLVNEMDNRNLKKIEAIHKTLKLLFKEIESCSKYTPLFRPRFLLLYAYYKMVNGNKSEAFRYLNKASEQAKNQSHLCLQIWIQHTRNHWKGLLIKKYQDFWAEHIEADNLLDYREFDFEKGHIVPYTLPLPKDFEK